jgi:hypothetical protein
MSRNLPWRRVAALLAVVVPVGSAAAAPVLCQKKRGAVVVRDPACKRGETPLDLAAFGAVGPAGPPGPQGPPGPTAASYGVRNPSYRVDLTATPQTIVSLTHPVETGASGGRITVTEQSHLQITAAIEMHHSGGTTDLPLGISCQPLYDTGTSVFEAGQPTRMEVFGQSNHNAYVTMPIVADVVVGPGTYDVRIACRNGFPEDYTVNTRSTNGASLNVIAVRR